MTTQFIINHLWQSSCFAVLAGLLAFVLRKNSPKVRYWVWLSASLKFLVPFALLVSLGSMVPRPARNVVSVPAPVFQNTLVQITVPFSPTNYVTAPAHTQVEWAPVAMGILWTFGLFAVILVRYRSWSRVRAALRSGTSIELPIPLRALVTPGVEEPGVVGFLRPVLVLPTQLLEHLNPRQLDAVLAHELCHVRRRDNLFAAVHMIVEAIFWFHPLVWWIGSRMIEERELACDEEVLLIGCDATDYVEGILKVCRLYTESPLPCVSGVTGADVKKRLRAILAGSVSHELNSVKKVTLATIGLAALAVPILVGVLNAPALRAQNVSAATPKFEVAAIKPCDDGDGQRAQFPSKFSPGRMSLNCQTLVGHILTAYVRFADGRTSRLPASLPPVEGGPAWIKSLRYTIDAKAEGSASPELMQGPMLQALLEDRFKLKIHGGTREIPVYELTVSKGGLKLPRFKEGSCAARPPRDLTKAFGPPPALPPGQKYCAALGTPKGPNMVVDAQGISLEEFAKSFLSPFLNTSDGRPVVDKTGVTGKFDFHMEFALDEAMRRGLDEDPGEPTAPSIFTALQEQLGLKLEGAKGLGEVLVIDSVERLSEN